VTDDEMMTMMTDVLKPHRHSQEFVLEGDNLLGGGTPDPLMATVSLLSKFLGGTKNKFGAFFVKTCIFGHLQGGHCPLSGCACVKPLTTEWILCFVCIKYVTTRGHDAISALAYLGNRGAWGVTTNLFWGGIKH